MEDVLLDAVLPVREALLVVTCCLDRCIFILEALNLWLATGTLFTLEDLLHSGFELHFVRIDNFSLFL